MVFNIFKEKEKLKKNKAKLTRKSVETVENRAKKRSLSIERPHTLKENNDRIEIVEEVYINLKINF